VYSISLCVRARIVLQRVAVCCSVLQCAAVCCSVLQCVAVCCSVLSVLQFVAVTSSRVVHAAMLWFSRQCVVKAVRLVAL